MHPERIFEKLLVESSEVCNYCFRRKARRESIPSEGIPDCVVPRLYPSGSSEKDYPPPSENSKYFVERDYYFKKSGTSRGSNSGDRGGTGRDRPIVASNSKSEVVCTCGRLDDNRINGEFPDDWDNRPKEKLEEIGRRVYHRLDEQEVKIDYDVFSGSLEEYKTSDEYGFGDYEILEKSVADSVSVKPNA